MSVFKLRCRSHIVTLPTTTTGMSTDNRTSIVSEPIPPLPSSESLDWEGSTEDIDRPNQEDARLGRSATPFAKRVSSICLPDDQSLKDVEELAVMLQLDLDKTDYSCFADSLSDLLSVMHGVFPDAVLPFRVDKALLDKLPPSVYNAKRYMWAIPDINTKAVIL
jgi:hypothetical protein